MALGGLAGEYPSNRRPPRMDTTFGARRPGSRACRHAARNRLWRDGGFAVGAVLAGVLVPRPRPWGG